MFVFLSFLFALHNVIGAFLSAFVVTSVFYRLGNADTYNYNLQTNGNDETHQRKDVKVFIAEEVKDSQESSED